MDSAEPVLGGDTLHALLAACAEPGIAPPARLRARVLARVAAEARPGFTTMTREARRWTPRYPGIETSVLHDDGVTCTWLTRMAPGAVLPAHGHAADEECVVLEGDVDLGGTPMRAGDYQLARAGTRHEDVHTRGGCLLLVRSASWRSGASA